MTLHLATHLSDEYTGHHRLFMDISATTSLIHNSHRASTPFKKVAPFCFAEIDERCACNTKFLRVLRSVDLATISFPGRTSISFVDGEDTPIALDLCTSVSLLFYLIFIIFSVHQRHGASWGIVETWHSGVQAHHSEVHEDGSHKASTRAKVEHISAQSHSEHLGL
jgi:hypothetical protein